MAELTTIARPYAKAAFSYALASNSIKEWEAMLNVAAAIAEDPTMQEWLDQPALTAEQRAEGFAQVCGDALSEEGKNLIAQLTEHNRVTLLPTLYNMFHEYVAAEENALDVELVSATELAEEQVTELVSSLKKRLNKEVRVSTSVDERLIGGVLIRAGDTVIDGSVRGKLTRLAEQLNS
ncbi:MAG TPA: F0F1 ATP synthase subunit delta [Alcanivoracaceae bacterium]|nr:F0F1 ATP synthase subunit delta [Alcanivoracaceae bacterium]